nr:hypothetical protein [Pedobacter sp. ASV2]
MREIISVKVAGVYSDNIEFDKNTLSFRVQEGVTNRRIDYDKILFLDQIKVTI